MTDVVTDLNTDMAETAAGYRALRQGTALVDYTGAGLLNVSGSGAAEFLGRTSTRSVDFLLEGQVSSALMLAGNGTIIAEVVIYCLGAEYLVEIWPQQAATGRAHLLAAAGQNADVKVEDLSAAYVILGIEGPESFRIAEHFLSFPIASMAFRSFAVPDSSTDLALARIGVTGEYGYKFIVPAADAPKRRQDLKERGALPVGRNALNVCRMETRFANIEAEGGNASVTPFDIGVQWMVDFQHEFNGREALLELWRGAPEKSPVCWHAEDGPHTVPAHGAVLTLDGTAVGVVSHAEFSPSLGRVIGTAQVNTSVASPGLRLDIDGTTVHTISAPFLVATSFGIPLE